MQQIITDSIWISGQCDNMQMEYQCHIFMFLEQITSAL